MLGLKVGTLLLIFFVGVIRRVIILVIELYVLLDKIDDVLLDGDILINEMMTKSLVQFVGKPDSDCFDV